MPSFLKRKNESDESDAATAEGSNRGVKRVRSAPTETTPSPPPADAPTTAMAIVASVSADEMQREVDTMRERLTRLEQDNQIKTAALERVHRAIECVICHDVMRNPQTLQCGHSSCYGCLRKWFTATADGIARTAGEISTEEEESDEGQDNEAGPSHAPYPSHHARHRLRRRHRFHSVVDRPKQCPTCRGIITKRPTTDYTLRHTTDALRPTPLSDAAEATRNQRWARRADMWRGIFPPEVPSSAAPSGQANNEAGAGAGDVVLPDPVLNFGRARRWNGRGSALPRREREAIRPQPYAIYRRDLAGGHAATDGPDPQERIQRWLRGGTTADGSAGAESQNLRHRQRQVQLRRGRVPPISSPLSPPLHTDEFHLGGSLSRTTPASTHHPVFISPPSPAPQSPLPGPSSQRSRAISQWTPSSSIQPSSSSTTQSVDPSPWWSSTSQPAGPSSSSLALPGASSHTTNNIDELSITTTLEWVRAFRRHYTGSGNDTNLAEADETDEDEATDLALIDAMFHGEDSTSETHPPEQNREYPVYVEELVGIPDASTNSPPVEVNRLQRQPIDSEEDENAEARLRRLEMFGDMAHDPGVIDSDVLVGVHVQAQPEAAADLED